MSPGLAVELYTYMHVMGEEEVHRIIFPLRRSGNGETPLYMAVQAAAERFQTLK